jgi:circadian clock protein KaiB
MILYDLTLFVSGASDLSSRAVADATRVCELHLTGEYQLSVVDVHDAGQADGARRVLAVPTLVKNRPLPARRIVGALSNTAKVLRALRLPAARTAPDELA